MIESVEIPRPPPDAIEFSAGVALGALAGAMVALALKPPRKVAGQRAVDRFRDRVRGPGNRPRVRGPRRFRIPCRGRL
jgi:hypothetical protein